ncbi:MAG: glutamine-hydrolyzing carbamoyl-phosphate synthase small subunit [Ruminococcus sp.]|nr:glutamine-hydrolyzing carbamoyl-phosphate synthase small subunit [Ruminococcus sp.]
MSLFNQGEKAYLMLANGQIFEGKSFGAKGTVFGEVVFSTAVVGFQETLTDPSNYGLIVTQTFPSVGNYGVNSEDNESDSTHLSGYVAREWCDAPSNFRMEGRIDDFLIKNNVVGICNIDTRCLTRVIREQGVMNGVITTEDVYSKKEELLEKVKAYEIKDAVKNVTCTEAHTYSCENAKYKVVLMDFGVKKSTIRSLTDNGCEVTVVPAYTTAETIKSMNPDGIMLSSGPGNPADNMDIVENLKEIQQLGIPMFGICLGHQLLALANGAETAKLKYGHRGANQPVIDLESGLTHVTSQNHGYEVLCDSIDPETAAISHVNANDKTCAGIRYKNINASTVQVSAAFSYDEFLAMMNKEVK